MTGASQVFDQESQRMAIAARLKLAREMAGLSQGQAAKILGWHRPTISTIEAGRRRVQAEELTVLADIYGVNMAWIMGETSIDEIGDKALLAARELEKLKGEDLDRLLRLIMTLKSSGSGSE